MIIATLKIYEVNHCTVDGVVQFKRSVKIPTLCITYFLVQVLALRYGGVTAVRSVMCSGCKNSLQCKVYSV